MSLITHSHIIAEHLFVDDFVVRMFAHLDDLIVVMNHRSISNIDV